MQQHHSGWLQEVGRRLRLGCVQLRVHQLPICADAGKEECPKQYHWVSLGINRYAPISIIVMYIIEKLHLTITGLKYRL